MTRIIMSHGIGQQQRGPNQMLKDWKAGLRDGVDFAVGKQERKRLKLKLVYAFYGDLFLPHGAHGSKDKGMGPEEEPFSCEDIEYFKEIQQNLAPDEPEPTFMGAPPLPAALRRLAAWLDRKSGLATHMMFFGDLKQVRRYQCDEELAAAARKRLAEAMSEGADVVVSHSLGSVIAYETLCLLGAHGVRTFVTLGSPLALPSIERRLRTHDLPPGMARWVNIYDPRDPVSCAGGLAGLWPQVDDVTVHNGYNPHAAERYLTKQATGSAIAGLP